uniref:Anaphase-promoting complex subunit 4-like WD40 domain-containing protein n=1 Tax=Parascaris univalens TaxID=6257 RepID=A0A915BBK9_PARUN
DIMCEEAKPDYVHYSLNEIIKCCATICLFDENFLLIGTSNGYCRLLNFESMIEIADVYEDEERRQIISVGRTSDVSLFVHIRAFAVLSIRVIKSKKGWSFEVMNKFSTAHYGFCRTLPLASGLLIPSNNAEVKITHGSNERVIALRSSEFQVVGTLSCLCAITPSHVLLGFDSGIVALFDIDKSRCLDKLELFRDVTLACATYEDFIAVSSVASPFRILRLEEAKLIEYRSVSYPSSARGCGSLCFSPCGKQVVSGFWDGSVRVHSLRTGNLRALLTLHSSAVNFLSWSIVNRKRLLFVCGEDSKLSIWNLHKDP